MDMQCHSVEDGAVTINYFKNTLGIVMSTLKKPAAYIKSVDESDAEDARARLNIPKNTYILETSGVQLSDSPYMAGWVTGDTEEVPVHTPTPVPRNANDDPQAVASRVNKIKTYIPQNGYKASNNGYAMPFSE